MIEKAIVLATQNSSQSDLPGVQSDPPGVLTEIGDASLIKRSLSALEANGIHDVIVVTGPDGNRVRRHVSSDPDVTASIVWLRGEGQGLVDGLLRARPYLDGPTLVLHGNYLYSPEMLASVVDWSAVDGSATLLVDREVSRVFDVKSALKVHCGQGRVLDVGYDLQSYEAVSVGLAVLTPGFIDLADAWGLLSATDVLRNACLRGVLAVREVHGAYWQQVASAQTKLHAEWLVRACAGRMTLDSGLSSATPSGPDPKRTLSYIEGLLSEKQARHYVLMNPGPVLTSARVKSALVHHDVCHRDEDCAVLVSRLERKLRRVCRGGPEHDIVLLSGSGTAAMEAAIASSVAPGAKLLVISNGAFGERFAEIAAVHCIETVHLKYEWGDLVDVEDIERVLRGDAKISTVAMCQHETSVGIINPVHQVGHLCRKLDRLFVVDAVSGLGGEDVDVRRDKIDLLISSANKCLHAISGVSFVCVHQRVWPRVEHVPARVYYLDLKLYRSMKIPFTPAVSNLFALDAALDELLRDGVEQRIAHYQRLNGWLRQELKRLGLRQLTDTGRESHTITTWCVPPFLAFEELYQLLKARGYIIYSCKAHLEDRCFQIANMGELTDEMVQGFIDAMAFVLRQATRHQPSEMRVAS